MAIKAIARLKATANLKQGKATAAPVFTKIQELVKDFFISYEDHQPNSQEDKRMIQAIFRAVVSSLGQTKASRCEKMLQQDASSSTWRKLLAGGTGLSEPLRDLAEEIENNFHAFH